ncbi:hypothetical protein BCEN4_70011 [Burkholderia cenocepacia]|nr:hypothetical protein BCEN4_70011 [Burkholderia cenocepacia]
MDGRLLALAARPLYMGVRSLGRAAPRAPLGARLLAPPGAGLDLRRRFVAVSGGSASADEASERNGAREPPPSAARNHALRPGCPVNLSSGRPFRRHPSDNEVMRWRCECIRPCFDPSRSSAAHRRSANRCARRAQCPPSSSSRARRRAAQIAR